MSNLTKEECVACLSYEKNMSPTVKKCFEILIEEHFDNPPLDEEWFKNNNNKWIWDNILKIKVLFRFYSKDKLMRIRCSVKYWDCQKQSLIEKLQAYYFEENRFYANEVKDDVK